MRLCCHLVGSWSLIDLTEFYDFYMVQQPVKQAFFSGYWRRNIISGTGNGIASTALTVPLFFTDHDVTIINLSSNSQLS